MLRTTFPPLDKVDPVKAWQPWEPDEKQPWNLKWAGHLYRRAAFGANLAELRQGVKQGHAVTLKSLFEPDADKERDFLEVMADTGKQIARQRNSFRLRGWW